jgi:hypothetical protein
MARSHHQQSLQRKIVYIALILAIFFVLIFYRPSLEANAMNLSLRDQDRGEVEVTGKVVTLGLTGLRGVVITALWSGAKEKMEKNQWNELELLVRSVTKLQPHFVTPWLFQSWNLAYNVAVKCDREADQYFYITRGIELLAEGERQNLYNPEMRYYVGFYDEHKIMQADRTSVLAAMHHMSCIDPVQRDPRRFRKPDKDKAGRLVFDMVEFEKFCQEHPHLVRRLREKVHLETPEDVVQFLDENQRVPSIHEDDPQRVNRPWKADEQTKLRAPGDRFPVLPPSGPERRRDDRALTQDSPLEDHIDAFHIARAWFSYAVEALPDPSWIPGRYKAPTAKQKVPRFTTQLFRHYPARAQSYAADRLEQDGWFDNTGWTITRWFPKGFSSGKPAVVGTGRNWAVDAWSEAYTMWQEIGEKHGLYMTPEEERTKKKLAEEWQKINNVPNAPPPDLANPDQLDPGMEAFIIIWNYEYYRRLSNYPHFLYQSQVFALPETVQARKHFHLAAEATAAGNRRQAIEEFETALPAYKEILQRHADFRTDDHIMEETLDFQLDYVKLCRELFGRQWKQTLALEACLGLAAAAASPIPESLALAQLGRAHVLPEVSVKGPLDDCYDPQVLVRFAQLKSPSKGPPPGVDPRAAGEMMRRGMMMGPQGQMPSGGRIPPGMLPPDANAPGGPPGGKK